MGLKHKLTKIRMLWTHIMRQKRGGLNGQYQPKTTSLDMWMSHVYKKKCTNAKVPPWRFLMKIPSFTAVEFSLCNIPIWATLLKSWTVAESMSALNCNESGRFGALKSDSTHY
jgi:hypothetical protein